jgi:asparagine synthase (glutamine-hydrolysing)
MCSISGVWNLDNSPIAIERVQRLSAAMKHRGPDGAGMHVDRAVGLALSNNRLAIVEPSDRSAQPMAYGQERYWITFNGEIYNFIELRNELVACGFQFSTNSDTEVVLAAHARWGTACQLKFNGMWAFAIWDSLERTLFVSRDRFGVKPLYYRYDGRRFVFASEVKAFLALDQSAPDINLAYLATSISTRNYLLSTPQTLLQDAKRLEAGHCLTIAQDGTLTLVRWWNTLDHVEAAPKRFEEQIALFKELFADACRIRLRTPAPVSVSLSGGMDSTSVLATVSQITRAAMAGDDSIPDSHLPRAYVATFSDAARDESRMARLLVEQLGVEACYERVSPLLVADDIDRMLFHAEDIHSIHPANWAIYQAMRRDHVRVALTGDGSDELFVAYPPHLAAAVAETRQHPLQPIRYLQLKRLVAAMLAEDDAVHSAGWQHGPQATRSSLYESSRTHRSVLGPGYADDLLPGADLLMVESPAFGYSDLAADLGKLSEKRLLARQLYFDFHYGILPWILHLKDMIAMAHGVEIRSPFMDWRIVCFAFALPSSSLIGEQATKRILREAMRGILPEAIRQRKSKVSFVSHEGSAFWQMRTLVLETTHSRAFLESPLWPGKQMQRLIEKTYRDRDNSYTEFFWRCIKATRLMAAFAAHADR